MTDLAQRSRMHSLVLSSATATELMTRSPLSFEKHTSVPKASAMLDFYELEAAPVVDERERPVGVISKAHCAAWKEFSMRSSRDRSHCETCDSATVTEIMHPHVAIVQEHDPSRKVLQALLRSKQARVYVVGDQGELKGVVSTSDILRHLLASDTRRRVRQAGAQLSTW